MAVLINSFVPSSAHIVGGQFNLTPPTLVDGQCSVLELDASGNLKVNVVSGGGSGSNAAAGPTGSPVPADADYQGVNVGGTLRGVTGLSLNAGAVIAPTIAIVDGSGNQITNFNVVGTTVDGTTTETNFLVVGGETNDATAQYQPIPLGAGGRSVIVEGIGANGASAVGNPVLVGTVDGTGLARFIPVGQNGGTPSSLGYYVQVGGVDAVSNRGQALDFLNGALITTLAASSVDSVPNLIAFWPGTGNSKVPAAVVPYVFNASSGNFDRLYEAGATGMVGVGGAAASGTAKSANPVQIGGVFNSTQPTVTSGQVVEAQSTASGALIVATGVDAFNVTDKSTLLDEYGNKVAIAEDTQPWRQALLDEMRAVRLGLQTLCRYINPGSGIQYTPNSPVGKGTLDSNEPDLIAWAQSIRDGAEEVIQG